MMSEFSSTLFNLDSRFFKTVGALFLPGKLTEEYFKGRHRRYLHPLRVFLVMTLALVSAATFSISDADFMELRGDLDNQKSKSHRYEFLVRLDTLKDKTAEKYNNSTVTAALDTLFDEVSGGRNIKEKDSTELTVLHFFDFSINTTPINIAVDDLLYMELDSIWKNYELEGSVAQYMTGQQIRLRRKGANFGVFLFGNVTWMVLIMMPLLAIVLKLLYIRRDYYYVEHLIFSFHTHAFAFLLYVLMILFGGYAPGWIIGGGFILLAFYLYKAMRRVYDQPRWKTLIKYLMVNILYVFILSMAGILTFLISFAIF